MRDSLSLSLRFALEGQKRLPLIKVFDKEAKNEIEDSEIHERCSKFMSGQWRPEMDLGFLRLLLYRLLAF